MQRFAFAHATHPQWRMAAALVLAQLRAQLALPGHDRIPALGFLYITDHYAPDAQAILALVSAELREVTDWVGGAGFGIAATGVEYVDEPALAVMLCELGPDRFRVFSGVAPLPAAAGAGGFVAHTAWLHADPATPDLGELVGEVADRTVSGQVFGGLSSGRGPGVQFALGSGGTLRGQGAASGVFHGGISGVAFGPDVALISRVTQGVQPIDRERVVTEVEGNLLLKLDDEPALDLLLRECRLSLERPEELVQTLRHRLVGLSAPDDRGGEAARTPRRVREAFGDNVSVRHIIGLDPGRRGVAVAAHPPVGTRLALCERSPQAARADLMRVCSEIREALEPEVEELAPGACGEGAAPPSRTMVGALYVSCTGRGGAHFGGPSAELNIVRHALGDVPLVGFFAAGEIAHRQVHGYTGVLLVFTAPAD
ncbi:MAG: FIST N-terminal domain-containing protein [Hydrogenophaga sp.]